MTNKATLINVLSAHHQGKQSGIRGRDLALKVGVNQRALRKLISAARFDGLAICGTPVTGYFVALTADELKQSAAFWHARALHSLTMEARVLQVSMGELLGQIQLSQG